ncbi:MAG TPA: glucose-6-phosphate dehydrogenase assembly protein OpcA [Isosphaeraceae bacterium]|nr:glucose-6-phosphate dehydrogenase assembly protein OpcA [Isosphaeraceae bacterium]
MAEPTDPAPATSTDAFLQGQGIPVALHDIETELNRLWGPAAVRVGGPDLEEPTVTRIVLANLVVLARQVGAERVHAALESVTARYPSRTICVRRTDEPGRAIGAEVSALCHLPAPGLPQVCSERIVLRAGPQATDLLPGAIRPLLEADLPFVLWWTDDPRRDEALFRDLGDECSRLILDLPDPGADPAAIALGLDPTICRYSRDSAWFGLTRWRELIAQFFDPPSHTDTLSRIDSVRIAARAPGAEAPPRLAIWLAAWLAGQLGWRPEGRPERSGGQLRATFRGPAGPIPVAIDTEAVPGLAFAQLSDAILTTKVPDGAETFRLHRPSASSHEVRVSIDSPAYCTLPRVVLVPPMDPPHRVAAALESSRLDPPYRKALPHTLWLLSG